MNKATAKAILNDPDYVSAYVFYKGKPMESNDETVRLATDWLQAVLVDGCPDHVEIKNQEQDS